MFDDVKFADRHEMISYVERSIAEAAPRAQTWRGETMGLVEWRVVPPDGPEWSAGYSLLALPNGELFFWVHDNMRVGTFSHEHAMSNAKIIYRLAFGAYVGGGEVFSLASALTLLLATTGPNRESMT